MAIKIQSTHYSGDVLETMLTRAVTGNELVERGLIRIEPGVNKRFVIPRLRTGKMLQKRVEQPVDEHTKGEFTYDEVAIEPKDLMAFTTFNPRSFEQIWRPYQPQGNLVFRELPPEVQNALLAEVAKTVSFELGYHLINGVYGDGEDQFFNGLLTNILGNKEVIRVSISTTSMISRLFAAYRAIPKPLRSSPNLRILMSQSDFDVYDEELSALPHKGGDVTGVNIGRYKGIKIEPLAQWPDGVIVATVCGMDLDTNLWAACNLQDDADVIQVDKLTNSGERYFIKLLMTMDTAIAFGQDVVLVDWRTAETKRAAKQGITAVPKSVVLPAEGGAAAVLVKATDSYTVGGTHTGFTVKEVEGGLIISSKANATESDKSGTIELSLADSTQKAIIEIYQGNGKK